MFQSGAIPILAVRFILFLEDLWSCHLSMLVSLYCVSVSKQSNFNVPTFYHLYLNTLIRVSPWGMCPKRLDCGSCV